MRRLAALMVLGTALAITVSAAEPTDLKPIMTERGKELFKDSLTEPFSKEWKVAKGKWEVVDGTMRGSELKEDNHGAAARHEVAFTNAVIQFSFKLDGGKTTSLSLNGAKGHVCRVSIRPTGFTVQKDDQDGPKGPDKAVVLSNVATPISTGEWHTMLVEMHGKEMLATLDGKYTGYGENDAIDKPKTNVGLTVGGESVSFKDLRVWEATPSKDWEKVKEKYKKN